MGAPAIARVIATRVLHRVAAEAAWASPALDAEITRARADERDAALATAIAYGTLRSLGSIDHAIASQVTRKGEIEPVALAALRAAAFQLLHLRTPPHAVVSDTVSIVRAQRGEGLARFANAVLRKIARDRPDHPEPPDAIEVPEWLAREIERGLGSSERARSFLRARPLPPPIDLRVAIEKIGRAELAQTIRDVRPAASVRERSLSPRALAIARAGDPRALPGWDEGLFAVQDEGSQLVAMLLEARPGETIADACAGRGGKTTFLAERVGPRGKVAAVDLFEPKLDRIPGELARLGIPRERVETSAIDLSAGCGGLERRFDRVLLDAPCTGLGTVHRRPEILLRIGEGDPARMGELQRAIARNAARLARPGGTLVIAVCSPSRAEGPELADALEREIPALERLREPAPDVPILPDADGIYRIGPFSAPGDDGPDCYQVVRYIVR